MTMISWKSLSKGYQGKEISVCFVTMASRSGIVDKEGIDELKNQAKTKTRNRAQNNGKTFSWSGRLKEERRKECVDLDKTLSQFYAEVRKESGEDYEPDSLRVMQATLERHLKSKLYPKSIIKDREFLSSRKNLEGKARKLREDGRGKRPNRSESLTNEEIEPFGKVVSLAVEIPEHLSTRCGGCWHNTLACGGDKSIRQHESWRFLSAAGRRWNWIP